jgi:hypothetical protein
MYREGDRYGKGDLYREDAGVEIELVCLQCGNRKYLDLGQAFWNSESYSQYLAGRGHA